LVAVVEANPTTCQQAARQAAATGGQEEAAPLPGQAQVYPEAQGVAAGQVTRLEAQVATVVLAATTVPVVAVAVAHSTGPMPVLVALAGLALSS